jgi:hypothetical protein
LLGGNKVSGVSSASLGDARAIGRVGVRGRAETPQPEQVVEGAETFRSVSTRHRVFILLEELPVMLPWKHSEDLDGVVGIAIIDGVGGHSNSTGLHWANFRRSANRRPLRRQLV